MRMPATFRDKKNEYGEGDAPDTTHRGNVKKGLENNPCVIDKHD